MHYHLEVIMPPTNKIKEKIEEVMKDFSENREDEESKYANSFWDFYIIGGRWSGDKLRQTLDKKKLNSFYKELKKRKITVSSFTAGKQELNPKNQVTIVDKVWNDFFPKIGGKCPLFNHYNNQYDDTLFYPDVMKVKELPKKLICNRVIVAVMNYDETKLEAETMIEDSYWNGVSINDTKWNKTVKSVIEEHNDSYKNAKKGYAKKRIVKDNWLVVTVDYHS